MQQAAAICNSPAVALSLYEMNEEHQRLKERISRLAAETKTTKPEARTEPQAEAQAKSQPEAQAELNQPSPLTACGELVAPLVVGMFIGVMLDNWLRTAPLMMILFFFLGAAAGIRGVFRLYK